MAAAAVAGMFACGEPPTTRSSTAPPVSAASSGQVAASARAAAAAPAPRPLADERPSVDGCERGDAEACADAARLLDGGWGVRADRLQAGFYAGIACVEGVARACLHRAELLYVVHQFTGTSREAAMELAAHAAAAGVAGAAEFFPAWPTGPTPDRAKLIASGCGPARWACVSGLYHAPEAVAASCADGNPAACEAGDWGPNGAIVRAAHGAAMAVLCRDHARGCAWAKGEDARATAELRRRACFDDAHYGACEEYARAGVGDALLAERAFAHACLHRPARDVAVGASTLTCDARGSAAPSFPSLRASSHADDRELARRVSERREGAVAKDVLAACAARRVDPWQCVDAAEPFARGEPSAEVLREVCGPALRALDSVCALEGRVARGAPARRTVLHACARKKTLAVSCRPYAPGGQP